MKDKLLITGLFLSSLFGACIKREPKSITVVPHVIKLIDTVKRYNPVFMMYENHYRYEFWDDERPIILKKNSNLSVGDTILYIYYEY